MRFRPCIDLHDGRVKQIVGSTLSDSQATLRTNFSSDLPPAHYATLYRRDNLTGGHIIMLGGGNEETAREALAAWPGGMQIGGGITADNAVFWLDQGASHLIVTSHVFHDGQLDRQRLDRLMRLVGRNRLVLDLSCRWRHDGYYVVTDRWQRFTELRISPAVLDELAAFCDEFLVHAVDVEGKCMGIDTRLLQLACHMEHLVDGQTIRYKILGVHLYHNGKSTAHLRPNGMIDVEKEAAPVFYRSPVPIVPRVYG